MHTNAVIWHHNLKIEDLTELETPTVWYWHGLDWKDKQSLPVWVKFSRLLESSGIAFKKVDSANFGQVYNAILHNFIKSKGESLFIWEGHYGSAISEMAKSIKGFVFDTDLACLDSENSGVVLTHVKRDTVARMGYVDPAEDRPMSPYWNLSLTKEKGECLGNQSKLAKHNLGYNEFGATHAGAPSPDLGVPITYHGGYRYAGSI